MDWTQEVYSFIGQLALYIAPLVFLWIEIFRSRERIRNLEDKIVSIQYDSRIKSIEINNLKYSNKKYEENT